MRQAGRFATTPEQVRAFADSLAPTDEVALEVTGNTWAIATLLASRAGRVAVSNPAKTRAIAEAKVKMAADLFGIKGRVWLAEQQLPADEQAAAAALLRQLDFYAEDCA